MKTVLLLFIVLIFAIPLVQSQKVEEKLPDHVPPFTAAGLGIPEAPEPTAPVTPVSNVRRRDKAVKDSNKPPKQLTSLAYNFKGESFDIPTVPGEMLNLSFSHLAPFLQSESTQSAWIVVFFHIPDWPLTPIMLPRVNHVARQYPNMTFISVDCTNISSTSLMNWDLSGMPSFVVFRSRVNLADHTGSATTSTLVKLLRVCTGIDPLQVTPTERFDDVTLRTDDLPRLDPLLLESIFALIWGLRWLLSKTAILGPLLDF